MRWRRWLGAYYYNRHRESRHMVQNALCRTIFLSYCYSFWALRPQTYYRPLPIPIPIPQNLYGALYKQNSPTLEPLCKTSLLLLQLPIVINKPATFQTLPASIWQQLNRTLTTITALLRSLLPSRNKLILRKIPPTCVWCNCL